MSPPLIVEINLDHALTFFPAPWAQPLASEYTYPDPPLNLLSPSVQCVCVCLRVRVCVRACMRANNVLMA